MAPRWPRPACRSIDRPAVRGFDRLYGLELLDVSDSEVRAQVAVREEIKQPVGLVHGGVYASIAESIASLATALAVLPQGEMAMGLSNSTSFLRPITDGRVHAHATRLHRGRTTWVWDVRFSDDADRTCAVTRMTIAVRPRRPAGRGPSGTARPAQRRAAAPVPARAAASRRSRCRAARAGSGAPGAPGSLIGTIVCAAARGERGSLGVDVDDHAARRDHDRLAALGDERRDAADARRAAAARRRRGGSCCRAR